MNNTNQTQEKSIEERQTEIYEAERNINEQLTSLEKQREQLNKQKEEIEAKKNGLVADIRRSKLNYIKEHKDIILPLFKHIGNCSDEKPYNGFDKTSPSLYCACSRCGLIQVVNEDWGTFNIDFDFDITFFKAR